MSQIVKPHAAEAGCLFYGAPWPVKNGKGLSLFSAWENKRIAFEARQAREDSECRRVEKNRFLAGLRIRQVQQPALEINVGPFRMKDLAHPPTRQDQETNCRDCIRINRRGP